MGSAIIVGLPVADRSAKKGAVMLLDLTRYRRPFEHVSKTFDPGEVNTGDEAYSIVAPVVFDVLIQTDTALGGTAHGGKAPGGGALKGRAPAGSARFRLVGSVRTELELPCSRCLEPYRLPVAADIDLRLHPESALAEGSDGEGEHEVAEDDLEVSYYRDDQIDVKEILREQFYLALPMKPLCRETCQGMCAECGVNKNVATCGCAPHWEDPRLAPLKRLAEPSGLAKSRPS
jgi:uncharacterized protein